MGIVSKRIHGWHLLQAFIEMLGSAGLFWAMFLIWLQGSLLIEDAYPAYCILVMVTIMADNFYQIREPRFISATNMAGDWKPMLRRTLYVALAWFGFLAARQDMSVSRLFLFTYLVCLYPCLLLTRLAGRKYLAPKVFGPRQRFGVILLGNPSGAGSLVRWLASRKDIGISLLGYLHDSDIPNEAEIRRLGAPEELSTVLQRTEARLVVSMTLPSSDSEAIALREICDRMGSRLAFQCRLGGNIESRVSLCQAEGVTMLSIRSEPLQSPFNRTLKRATDICVALPVVVFILPPLALLVWLIQRIYSPGPLLFRQQRGGLCGHPFTLLKFRTMHCGGGDECRQATSGDERIFKGGGWLRRTSLDEFPQFINVLAGSMSVVGPRPHLGVHDVAFAEVSPEYRVRSHIKPGITGLAQVQGHRGPTPQPQQVNARVKADLEYMENWTLTTDLVLLLRTGLHLIRPTNAV